MSNFILNFGDHLEHGLSGAKRHTFCLDGAERRAKSQNRIARRDQAIKNTSNKKVIDQMGYEHRARL